MFVRLYAYADNDAEAKEVLGDVLGVLHKDIDEIEYVLCQPYWKIEGIFEIAVNVHLKRALTASELKSFFEDVSDRWMYFGDPANEALASITTEGCSYIKKGVNLINVVF